MTADTAPRRGIGIWKTVAGLFGLTLLWWLVF